MTNVLIAVDDSDVSLRAALKAHELFGDSASYTVVSVATRTLVWGGEPMLWGFGYPLMLSPTGGFGPAPMIDQDASMASELTQKLDDAREVAQEVADEADLSTAAVVGEHGDPAGAIIEAAHHHNADVIVVGSHERSWFSRLFNPAISTALISESKISVLVAR